MQTSDRNNLHHHYAKLHAIAASLEIKRALRDATGNYPPGTAEQIRSAQRSIAVVKKIMGN